jgi:transposase
VDIMEQTNERPRRRHDDELKERVLAECAEPGASVASVALRHGLNANLVHKWRRLARRGAASVPADVDTEQFLPVALPQPVQPREDIRIELRRGPTAVTVTWPLTAAAECASWMRELLR